MRADLHIHSVYSDGFYTPELLAEKARAAGLSLISITDHDNLGDAEEKKFAAEKYGLHYVQGWEVSAYEGCKVHVLGYGCIGKAVYFDFLEMRRQGAIIRSRDMIEKANAYFRLNLTLADAEAWHFRKETPLHTMHVVRAYAEALGKDAGELYRTCFARGCPAYSDLCRPSPEEVIPIIHEMGGIAVLAHPGRIELNPEAREKLMERLVRRGLDGIECHYTTHTDVETDYFVEFARARGLYETGGSDFHLEDGVHCLGRPRFYAAPALLNAIVPSHGGGK